MASGETRAKAYLDCVIPNSSFRGSNKTTDLVMHSHAAFADHETQIV